MVITRKIEVFICEDDKDLRKSYYKKLFDNRDAAVASANVGISHLFALDNLMPYLSQEDKDTVTFLGVKGTKTSKANAPYVAVSKAFKGVADMGMLSSVLQQVTKGYQDDRKKGMWNKSLRSYKSNMPIPLKSERFSNLRFAEYKDKEGKTHNGCFFTLIGIPFQMKFGRDRSNNQAVVKDVIEGNYKMCTSSILCDRNKIFLLLCVDIPRKEVELKKGKKMFAFLGVLNPIVCTCEVNAKQAYDSGMKCFEIGSKEEFNHRRRQIQEAVKRCQINNRYTLGGKGRKRKCQAIERFHDKEKNYVDTKLHTYSRMLVDLAIKHKCEEIVLMKQESREGAAKAENQSKEPFVLRNWSYYGLKEKIEYKSKMVGVKLTVEK
jgi:hypothetical protein